MVSEVCGIEPQVFEQVARWVTENSGRERTTAWVYSVGWTQHSVGAQYIRTAAILQTLLGNMGRPGGGIMALRGHARDRKSTRLNSSHANISYAVFCLKKKKTTIHPCHYFISRLLP